MCDFCGIAFFYSTAQGQVNLFGECASTPEAKTRAPVCNGFMRPDVTFFDRLQIATCFWDPQRPWGTVSELGIREK